MKIKASYKFGDSVVLKTDPDKLERIVTAVIAKPGNLRYELACGTNYSTHYDFEFTRYTPPAEGAIGFKK